MQAVTEEKEGCLRVLVYVPILVVAVLAMTVAEAARRLMHFLTRRPCTCYRCESRSCRL